MLVQAQESLLLRGIQFHRLGRGEATSGPSFSRGGAALLAEFQFQLGDGGHDAGNGTPRRSAGVHPFT